MDASGPGDQHGLHHPQPQVPGALALEARPHDLVPLVHAGRPHDGGGPALCRPRQCGVAHLCPGDPHLRVRREARGAAELHQRQAARHPQRHRHKRLGSVHRLGPGLHLQLPQPGGPGGEQGLAPGADGSDGQSRHLPDGHGEPSGGPEGGRPAAAGGRSGAGLHRQPVRGARHGRSRLRIGPLADGVPPPRPLLGVPHL